MEADASFERQDSAASAQDDERKEKRKHMNRKAAVDVTDTGCVAEEGVHGSSIPETASETLCDAVVSVSGYQRKEEDKDKGERRQEFTGCSLWSGWSLWFDHS